MAEYLVLIYGDEKVWETADEAATKAVMDGHMAFGEKHGAVIRGGNALESTSTATSIRKGASGEFSVTDGPFSETKEGLGGYYVIEAPDLDAALLVAKDIPAEFGGVEVRPIRVFD
jgi:hypothetical protein